MEFDRYLPPTETDTQALHRRDAEVCRRVIHWLRDNTEGEPVDTEIVAKNVSFQDLGLRRPERMLTRILRRWPNSVLVSNRTDDGDRSTLQLHPHLVDQDIQARRAAVNRQRAKQLAAMRFGIG
jgi:hypothetical protein